MTRPTTADDERESDLMAEIRQLDKVRRLVTQLEQAFYPTEIPQADVTHFTSDLVSDVIHAREIDIKEELRQIEARREPSDFPHLEGLGAGLL